MMLDLSKPVQTRDGRKVEILSVIKCHDYPLIVVVDNGEYEQVESYQLDGTYLNSGTRQGSLDLINIPKPKKKKKVIGWVNVYYAMGVTSQCLHLSKGESDKAIKLNMDGYITTVKVKVDSDKLK